MIKDPDFKVAVEVSCAWEGDKVAQELVNTIRSKTPNPKFILLFPTIHYEGELKKILTKIKNSFPNVPLIGETVAGFMSSHGCYTKGVSVLSIEYPRMDVSVGVGHNTKKNPDKAADSCIKDISNKLKESNYKQKFIFQLVSGATTPQFPGVGNSFVLKGKIKSSLAAKLIETSTKNMQKGIGREEEILQKISEKLKDAFVISASSCDDMSVVKNYQFINKEIFTNSIIALCLSTDKKINLNYNHGFHKFSDKKLHITQSSFDKRIVKKINNKDAVSEFTKNVNWSESIFEEIIDRKTSFYDLPTVYFPLGFEYPDKTLAPAAVGAILGKGFSFNYKIKSDDLFVLTATGRDIVKAMYECVDKNSDFIFGISCCGNLVTLGDDIYIIQEKISKDVRNFLILFTLGEGVYLPSEKNSKFFNEANILLSFK